MNSLINRLIILTIALIYITLTDAQEDDVNQLFCQLNEYARARVLNEQSVFPCRQ